jgi:serine/threonine protein kinase
MPVDYQRDSPYYFVGTYYDDENSNNDDGKRCFLKVWREDEDGYGDNARDEARALKQAQNHKVAVAKMVTDDLVSVSVNGIKFHVLVTKYIDTDRVSSVKELVDFSLSLMGVVSELHEQAGMLHCDIKPSNLRWRQQQVYLIDFGHAQMAEGAEHYEATGRFEAPEIRKEKLPHCRETDAYSVGASILWDLDHFQQWNRRKSEGSSDLDSRFMKELRVVGESLTAPKQDRISLHHASRVLMRILEDCKNTNEKLSPPEKRARLDDDTTTLVIRRVVLL